MQESSVINKRVNVFNKRSQLKEIWRRFKKNRAGLIGFYILIFILIVVFVGSLIIPMDRAIDQNYDNVSASPSIDHIMGTDNFGRDVLARILHGGKVSLTIGFTASIVSTLVGTLIGLSVGYYGGKFDNIIMRFMDIVSSIPTLLLAMTIVASLGSNTFNLILALTIANVPGTVRIVRSSAISVSGMEYFEASKAIGTKVPRILFKHLLPNVLGTVIIQFTTSLASIILYIATLSFVGLGVQPPYPEWGYMLSEAREYMRVYPMMMVYPGVSLALTTLALNLTGDGLRDAFDPKLKS